MADTAMALVIEALTVMRDQTTLRYEQTIQQGDIVTLQGRSGVGKTTLLLTLAGFAQAQSGHVRWGDQALLDKPAESRPISILFQENNLFEHISAFDNACLGMGDTSLIETRDKVRAASSLLQIDQQLHKKPSELSGGQRQRVALLRTLLRPEPIILLDEPFAELDPATRKLALNWTKDVAKANHKTVLMVTHQDEDVSAIADRNWVL